MNKIRVFIALCPTEEIKQKVVEVQATFPKVRLIKPENLHLTLIPPWYQDEQELKSLQSKLKSVSAEIKPFTINFTSISYGPTKHAPRLIWASGEAVEELSQLKEKLESSLNIEPEKRELLPHLTLARFRPEDFKSFQTKEINRLVAWEFTVKQIYLIQSHLNPKGAEYTIIGQYGLK